MIDYIRIGYIHKVESGCSGRVIARINKRQGTYDVAFDECNKNRRCGCIDTCYSDYSGQWWKIHEGFTTKDNLGSDACQSWVKKNKYF